MSRTPKGVLVVAIFTLAACCSGVAVWRVVSPETTTTPTTTTTTPVDDGSLIPPASWVRGSMKELTNFRPVLIAATVDPCADYDALEAGRAEAHHQDWFNHLNARDYVRYRGACRYGVGTAEWNCLDQKIGEESGWYELADGPGETWGIPQANPGDKMADHGPDWRTNGRVQGRWLLDYIEVRYRGSLFNDSNPCHAGY